MGMRCMYWRKRTSEGAMKANLCTEQVLYFAVPMLFGVDEFSPAINFQTTQA